MAAQFFLHPRLIFGDGTLIDSQRDLILPSTPGMGREQFHEDTISSATSDMERRNWSGVRWRQCRRPGL
jgi:hypothetical protein